ncbi:cytochrome P450 [Rhodopirellula sp.]|nr:cytochrome P450 [Rubripirellula sp.]MDA7874049.1 cytochrome P450 [Rhodopirellula sp.]MDA7914656.1 cytochrome P450 [bacterium]MDB4561384.1 cytochrome P450 [bacterium]MDB4621683.1 cytochrome P450 [Rubripirellula sp.]
MDESGCSKDHLHFGFGHGARVCPGKHLSELEASLVVGGIVKLFEFEAVAEDNEPKAGVSTKPLDGTRVRLRLRQE